jgi:hypothetical protein
MQNNTLLFSATDFTSILPGVEAIDCGQLSDITWPGMVSSKNIISSGDVKQKSVDEAVETINDYYVAVNPKAKARCIDGRHDPELDERVLGPQVPGGAPGAALAYRLGVDEGDLARGTFLTDAEIMLGRYLRLGFTPGGHTDDHVHSKLSIGCGAIDGMDKILATMTKKGLVDDHKRVVKLLLGSRFNRDNYLRVMGAAVVVNDRSEDYFRDRHVILDILEKRVPGSIATLEGTHKECLVVVNLVPNTTLSSNRLTAKTGVQAFGYDLWRSAYIAGRLMPRPDQIIERERFVMARVMSSVATLMALTDGTQKLLIRTESFGE